MDIRNPLTSLDINMLDWFAPRQKPIHVLLTKCDKLSKDKQNKTLFSVQKGLENQWSTFYQTPCTVQLFSSLKKIGLEEEDGVLETWLSFSY
jgi:GTP-binding protein